MNIRNISLSILAVALSSSIVMAAPAADKACLKKAKADYTEATKACKDKKGDEKKTCKKDAKTAYTAAKDACKAPAATEAAPAAAPEAAPAAGSAN